MFSSFQKFRIYSSEVRQMGLSWNDLGKGFGFLHEQAFNNILKDRETPSSSSQYNNNNNNSSIIAKKDAYPVKLGVVQSTTRS
jgi:hypothetical protein